MRGEVIYKRASVPRPCLPRGSWVYKRTGKRTSVPPSVLGDKRSWVEMFCAERGPSGARADVAPSGKAGGPTTNKEMGVGAAGFYRQVTATRFGRRVGVRVL